jgi:hypothetical protein
MNGEELGRCFSFLDSEPQKKTKKKTTKWAIGYTYVCMQEDIK